MMEMEFQRILRRAIYWIEKAAEQGHEMAQFRLRADRGDADAQYELSEEYYRGVLQDYEKAIYWFEKAAEQGHADAQYQLGWIYHRGQGVPKDYEKALYWWEKAAEQGHLEAQHQLHFMYSFGDRIPKDREKAAKQEQ